MSSDIAALAAIRKAHLMKQVEVSKARMASAEMYSAQNQTSLYPGLPVGPQYPDSEAATGTSKLLIDGGESYQDRDVNKAYKEAVKNFQQIMDGETANRFADTMMQERGPDESPIELFIVVDSWPAIKAEIQKRFKTKTTAATLYAWLTNHIAEQYATIGNEYITDSTQNADLKQLMEAKTKLESNLAMKKLKSDWESTQVGLRRADASQRPMASLSRNNPAPRKPTKEDREDGEREDGEREDGEWTKGGRDDGEREDGEREDGERPSRRFEKDEMFDALPSADQKHKETIYEIAGADSSKVSYGLAVKLALREMSTEWNPSAMMKGPLLTLINSTIILYGLDLSDLSIVSKKTGFVKADTPKEQVVALLRDIVSKQPEFQGKGLKRKCGTTVKGRGLAGKMKGKVKVKARGVRYVLGGGMARSKEPMLDTDKALDREAHRWPVPGKPSLYVDLKSLNGDKLSVRYRSSNLYKFSPRKVSPVAKAIVLDLITRGQFRGELFKTLAGEEQRALEQWIHIVGMDDVSGYNGPQGLKELRTNLDIYRGQIDAGNGHPKIKEALVQCVAELQRLKHLSATQAKQILAQYSLN